MAGEQNISLQMFKDLHQKFGANFFLTMFLLMLFAYGYAQKELMECQADAATQEKRFAEQMRAEQTKTIDYLKEQRDKVDILLYQAKSKKSNRK
jgi:hypothetical protein